MLMHAATWMKLEDMMLSEISQSQKDKHCVSPLYEVPRAVEFLEAESRMVVAREVRREGWGDCV